MAELVANTVNTRAVNGLAYQLAELWSDEWCEWKLDYEASSYGSDPAWRVDLDWQPESFPTPDEHGADWVRRTWQFYGDTPEEALRGAVEWCEGLLPFKRCDACGGGGTYNLGGNSVTCEDCGGTGLDSWRDPNYEGSGV